MSERETPQSSGPFAGPVNALLEESFGQSLNGLQLDHQPDLAAGMNAKAYTIGSKISLGAGIAQDVDDPHSMEIISHEVAHALAGGGSGAKPLDSGRGDTGEVGAHAASGAFKDFITGGRHGDAPKLTPAHGGEAAVHRFEAGEHADAVDSARATLVAANAANPTGPQYAINDGALKQAERPITLTNKMQVKPGDLTALMGDFYGVYTTGPDGKEHFDPAKSFEAMDKADPVEMQKLLVHIQEERLKVDARKAGGDEEFKPTANATFEDITGNRRLETTTNADGTKTTTGLSYMDLAQKNTNHFSTKDESGTDNNMGAYTALHSSAMQAAQQAASLPAGTEEEKKAKEQAEQHALAMEASSQHFLTDRFSAGHQLDKQQMIDGNGGGFDANMRALTIHGNLNKTGTTVGDRDGTKWFAMGDAQWADEGNAVNRGHTANSIQSSYGDIDDILSGRKTADDFGADKAGSVHANAPVFDDAKNADLQAKGKKLDTIPMVADKAKEAPLLPAMGRTLVKQQVIQPGCDWAGKQWAGAKQTGGETWDWTMQKGSDLSDGAGRVWDSAEQTGGETWDWAQQQKDGACDYGTKKVNEIQDGAGRAWDGAAQTASNTYDGAAQKASDTYDGAAQTASNTYHSVADTANDAYNGAADTASGVYDTAANGASAVGDAASKKYAAAKDWIGL